MNVKHALASAAIAALVIVAGPAAYADSESSTIDQRQTGVLAADGNLHAWEFAYGGGRHCAWSGGSNNWDVCNGTGNGMMRNDASDLWNNGTPQQYDAVDMYWGTRGTGAHACISQGDSWPNLPSGQWHFTYGQGLGGFGETVDNNISSHIWVDYCSQG